MKKDTIEKLYGTEVIFFILLSAVLCFYDMAEFGAFLCVLLLQVNWIRVLFNYQQKRFVKEFSSIDHMHESEAEKSERKKKAEEEILIFEDRNKRIKIGIVAYTVAMAIIYVIFLR